ncbi:MAG: hypothetical protein BRD42_06120 [Bacteroidetes bacterium QS_3_64_15]|nr:MAG: hypothetical protein BRD42_06120 [Bacteroidetes bacterium QS_3_64_15]
MSDPTLYIHVGPSKTATTFLQRDVLGRIASAECLPVPEIEVEGRRLRFGDLFSLSPEFWRGLETDPFADRVRHSGRDVVISDERICGGLVAPQPWIPGSVPGRGLPPSPRLHTHSRVDPYSVSSHFRELRRAADAWGYERVRVLLTPRRQDTKLASSYAQLSNRVRGAGQQNFETWVRHLLHDAIGHNKGGGVNLDYSLWWRELRTAVGTENVFFLPFELLREDRATFLRQWLGVLGVPEADSIVDALSGSEGTEKNVRSRSADTWTLRTPIKKGRFLLRWPDFSRESEIRLTEALRAEILAAYEEGNRSLDERCSHLNLGEYGYY